jgi:hypothetical protein
LAGSWGSSWGETRLGDSPTETLVLENVSRLSSLWCCWLHLQSDATGLGLAGDELVPGLGALTDDVHGVPWG